MRRIADRPAFADGADLLRHGIRRLGKTVGPDDGHHHRHRQRAGEVTAEHQAPVAQDAVHGDAGTLVDQGQRAQGKNAGEQVEAEQVEQDEANREKHGADQRLAGLDRDGDRESRRQRQDGAGHVGADQGVAGGHENFGFTGIDHFGDEFGRRQIGHGGSLFWIGFVLKAPGSALKAGVPESRPSV